MEGAFKPGENGQIGWLEQSFDNNKAEEEAMKCQDGVQPVNDDNQFEILENNIDMSEDDDAADDVNILQLLQNMTQTSLEDNTIDFNDHYLVHIDDDNVDNLFTDRIFKLTEDISEEMVVTENINHINQVDKSDLNEEDSEERDTTDNTKHLNEVDGEVSDIQQESKMLLEEETLEHNVHTNENTDEFREIDSKEARTYKTTKTTLEKEDQTVSRTRFNKQYIDEYIQFVDVQKQIKGIMGKKPTIDMLLNFYAANRSDNSVSNDLKDYDNQHDHSIVNLCDKSTNRYSCGICSKSYATKEKLKGHLYAHILESCLSCYLCSKKFNNQTSLEHHKEVFHRPYQCDLCSKRLSTKKTLVRHVKKHLYIPQVACKLCTQYFRDGFDLREHMYKEHNELLQYESQEKHADNLLKELPTNENYDKVSNEIPKEIQENSKQQETSESNCIESHSQEISQNDCGKTQEIHEHVLDKTPQEVPNNDDILQEAPISATDSTSDQASVNIHPLAVSTQIENLLDKCEVIQTEEGDSFRCTVCNKDFKMRCNLQRHMLQHTNYLPYTCSLCHRGFRRSDRLKEHVANYHSKRSFQCDFCQKAFGVWCNLKIHKIRFCAKRLPCSFCGKRYKNKDHLLKHVETDHPNKLKQYLKNSFDESKSSEEMKISLAAENIDNSDKLREEGQLKVLVENDISCDKIDTANSNESVFLLDSDIVCTKPYSDETERKYIASQETSHQKDNRNMCRESKENNIYSCTECYKVFKNQSNLQRHMSLHFKGYMFMCSTCGKCFQRNECLKRHCINYHPRKKPLSCRICEKTFDTNKVLEQHERMHNFTKGFLCFKCGITYRYENDLKNHVRRKHSKEYGVETEYEINSEEAIRQLIKETKGELVETRALDETGKESLVEEDVAAFLEAMTEMKGGWNSGKMANRAYVRKKYSLFKLKNKPKAGKESNRYPCRICNKYLSTEILLMRHMHIHSTKMPFVCSICERGFTRSDSLKLHIIRIHDTGKKSFECDVCRKTFASSSCLKAHEIIHSDARDFQCKTCLKKFKTNSDLRKHLKRVHALFENSIPDGNTSEKKCDETSLIERMDQEQAKEKPGNNNLNKECNENVNAEGITEDIILAKDKETADNGPQLQSSHTSAHTCTVKKSKYSCEICHKTFANRQGLRRHSFIHSGHLPFTCSVCERGFTRSDNLKIHMISAHTGEKMFECDICKKTFATRNYLECHRIVHSDIKKFQCRLCEKKYKSKSDLDKHVKKKHSKSLNISPNINNEESIVDENGESLSKELAGSFDISKDVDEVDESLGSMSKQGVKDFENSDQTENTEVDSVYKNSTGNDQDDRRTQTSEADGNESQEKDRNNINSSASMESPKRKKTNIDGTIRHERQGIKRNIKTLESFKKQNSKGIEESFVCSKCQKVFANKAGLKRHMVSHSEILPFVCSDCGKRFPRKDSLHLHTVTAHDGKKDFECEVCHKTFATKNYLKNHRAMHSLIKQFPCKFCEKSSKTNSDLLKHMKRLHPEKLDRKVNQFPCCFCEKIMFLKADLLKHIQKKHPEKLAMYKAADNAEKS